MIIWPSLVAEFFPWFHPLEWGGGRGVSQNRIHISHFTLAMSFPVCFIFFAFLFQFPCASFYFLLVFLWFAFDFPFHFVSISLHFLSLLGLAELTRRNFARVSFHFCFLLFHFPSISFEFPFISFHSLWFPFIFGPTALRGEVLREWNVKGEMGGGEGSNFEYI